MNRTTRTLGALALVVGSALACNRVELSGPPRASGPNLLLVTIDTLRADHVGAYGAENAHTPTLDTLAREGVRFETAIASCPLTLPSHATLLTGLQPPSHGVRDNGFFRLGPEAVTLAERLEASGWSTGAVVGAFVLARRFGLDQGFGVYDDEVSVRRANYGSYLERRAADVTDRALEVLERLPEPFFLWVHYYDPHAAYDPPQRWADALPGRPYDGEIAYVDAELGRLLEGLRAARRLERTLVVATSDHGESFGAHDEETHGYTLYDATLAVPLLLRGPGVPTGRVVGGVARHADVLPTVLARLGVEPPPELDGRDLAPLWEADAPPSRRLAYAESLATELHHGWSPLFAARSDTYHYVQAPRPELYRLARDPAQRHNLLEDGASPEEAAAAAELEAHIERMRAGESEPATPSQPDADTLERLRALGYALPERPAARTGLDPKDGLAALGDYFAALQALEVQNAAEARRRADTLLERLPDSPLAHGLLARLHVMSGRPDLALPHAETAASLLPQDVTYRVLVGDVKHHLGDRDGATRAWRQAAEQEPDHPLALAVLAAAEARADRHREAERAARRAVAQSPASGEIRRRIATAWEQAGAYERALEAYREALRLEPDAGETHMLLAIQYARLGQAADAERHLRAAGPWARVPNLRNRLAIVHAARGENERAEAILRDLIRRHPEYVTARRNLAILLERQGRGAAAPAPPAPEGSSAGN